MTTKTQIERVVRKQLKIVFLKNERCEIINEDTNYIFAVIKFHVPIDYSLYMIANKNDGKIVFSSCIETRERWIEEKDFIEFEKLLKL